MRAVFAIRRPVPAWARAYRRGDLLPDVVAGLVIWSVVVPQCVAYAQIAGLPPQAGLVAAPGALIAYALLGSSRTLVVSATTATAALSAAAVAPLAHGDAARFAALAAALAVITAAVLALAGLLKLGSLSDFVSKPIMTGFLFGLGLTIAVGQLPELLGIEDPGGGFLGRLDALAGDLAHIQAQTAAVGIGSIALLLALRAALPAVPGTLVVLVLAIAVSASLGLRHHGVDVVGALPDAFPQPALPDVGWADLGALLPAALGVLVLSAEAVGVARAMASQAGYAVDVNRELVALGASNLLAGLSPGFVQSGGASQTAAAARAGGRTQLASLVCAGLILLTGAVLAPLFEDLPQATLAAIVIVAVAGFWRVDELRRFARIRRSAIVLALLALAGVLTLGVLRGLLVTTALALTLVIRRLSRPPVARLARDPASGAWARTDHHPDWIVPPDDALVARVDGPLFYANAAAAKERLLALARAERPRPAVLVLDLADSHELDVQASDSLGELAAELAADGTELRLAAVHAPALRLLRASGVAERVAVLPTVDEAIARRIAPVP